MTKPVVATALMLLHEEAHRQLEHPVARYLPAFGKVQVLEATVRSSIRPARSRWRSLTHTSGLTYDFMADTPAAQYRSARTMNDASRSLEACIDEVAACRWRSSRNSLALQRRD